MSSPNEYSEQSSFMDLLPNDSPFTDLLNKSFDQNGIGLSSSYASDVDRSEGTHIDHLPNECLVLILKRLELKLPGMIALRIVSRRWQLLIETLFHSNRSLILYKYHSDKYEIKEHFCDNLDMQDFIELKLKHKSSITIDLCHFLVRMLPQVEELLFCCDFETSCYPGVFFLLDKWPQLSTLYANYKIVKAIQTDEPFEKINSLGSLRRLVLWGGDISDYAPKLTPTFARLHHFMFRFEYYNEDEDFNYLDNVLTYIGNNCTSINLCSEIKLPLIRRWLNTNPELARNLTRLYLSEVWDTNVVNLIGQYFTSLQVLQIEYKSYVNALTAPAISHLAQLAHLTELHLRGYDDNFLFQLEQASHTPLVNVKTFSIFNFSGTSEQDIDDKYCSNFDGERFCRSFFVIFPNLDNLTIITVYGEIFDKIFYAFEDTAKLPQFCLEWSGPCPSHILTNKDLRS